MLRIHVKERPVRAALFAFALVAATSNAFAQAKDATAAAPDAAAAPAAPADEANAKAKCATAFEQAQTDKIAGRYVAARAAALACSQLECGSLIVRECVQLYDALERDIPTIVVAARKAEGGELIDVRVEMDGAVIAEQLTGQQLAVDPGPHQFVFTHAERGRVEFTASARVGDRARVIEATFEDPNAKNLPPPLAPAPAGKPKEAKPAIPVLSYVLGGVGVVGLGGFALLRLVAASEYNDYASTCSPACNPEDVDALDVKYTLSYVSLGIGAASLAGAVIVFAVAGGGGENEVQASVAPRPDGAMVGLKTRF
jgi:hypothetical protein